jgi:hypothetical protein
VPRAEAEENRRKIEAFTAEKQRAQRKAKSKSSGSKAGGCDKFETNCKGGQLQLAATISQSNSKANSKSGATADSRATRGYA